MINGLVDREMIFTLDDLKRFPQVNKFHFLECAANGGMEWRGAQLNGCQYTFGMVHNVQYTGVKLSDLLQETGLKNSAKWILAEGSDSSGMTRSIPIEKIKDDCIVAWAMNGEALRPEQGYPVRLVVPGWEGNMWVKWLRRLEFGDKPYMTREETSKYTDLLSDGNARMFTWVMDAKSVITSPCPEKPVIHKGFNQIRGLAWSGRGKIKRVDVSFDGGKNWKNVTPNKNIKGGRVDSVEPSSHNSSKAFVTILRYQLGDWKPYIYRTYDKGNSWDLVTKGIPSDHPVRVLREDPKREGLLFAGTEFGMFISFDDGNTWNSFQQNLPVTPITDIKIHRNDVVLSTMGRSFWIMDNIDILRNFDNKNEDILYPITNTIRYRYRPSSSNHVSYPQNSVIIDYKVVGESVETVNIQAPELAIRIEPKS